MQDTTSAAAKKEECVDKDAEILRLEERRSMPKEERHRMKDLSKKNLKNVSEKKKSEKRCPKSPHQVNASLLEKKETPIPLEIP